MCHNYKKGGITGPNLILFFSHLSQYSALTDTCVRIYLHVHVHTSYSPVTFQTNQLGNYIDQLLLKISYLTVVYLLQTMQYSLQNVMNEIIA